MKGLDDGPDGLNDEAFERALRVPHNRKQPIPVVKVCSRCGAAKPVRSNICNTEGCISNVWVRP